MFLFKDLVVEVKFVVIYFAVVVIMVEVINRPGVAGAVLQTAL